MNRFISSKRLIIFVLVLAVAIRLISINQSLWLDEATSALVARMPLKEIFTKFLPGDFHPPLYYLVLKVWATVFGYSEVALRIPSVIFGTATIWVLYKIVLQITEHKSPASAIIAAVILSTSGLHIYYSQEARMYSLATFLVSLAIYLFLEATKKGGVGDWSIFSVILALIVMTDYPASFVLPVFWIYGFLSNQNNNWWKKFITSHIIMVGLGFVWLPYFIKQLSLGLLVESQSPAWWKILGQVGFKQVALIPTKFILGRISFDDKILYGFTISALLMLFSYLIIVSSRKAREILNSAIIWLWLIVPVSLGILISFRIPALSYFRYLFILPAFYILTTFGILGLPRKWKVFFVVVVLATNFFTSTAYLFNKKFHREDWRGLVELLDTREEAVVVFPAKSQREAFSFYNTHDIAITEVEDLSNGHKEVWLMRYVYEIFDLGDKSRLAVENLGYQKESEYNFSGVVVWKYTK